MQLNKKMGEPNRVEVSWEKITNQQQLNKSVIPKEDDWLYLLRIKDLDLLFEDLNGDTEGTGVLVVLQY